MFYKKGTPGERVHHIKRINKRNPNFAPVEYEDTAVFKNLKEPAVVLVDAEEEKKVRNDLKNYEEISYFVLDNNNVRNLAPEDNNTYFITKN